MAMQRTSASGVYLAEEDGDGAGRQPPEVLGAWIQRLLVDAAHPHEDRIRELQERYEQLAARCDVGTLMQAVRSLAEMLGEDGDATLPVGTVRQEGGSGMKPAEPASPLAAMYQRIRNGCDAVEARASEVAAARSAALSETRKLLLELDLEEQRLATLLMRVERWLQLMWKGITASKPAAGDSAAVHKLRVLVERTDNFRARLARLQQIADLAQDTAQIGRQVMQKREAVLSMIGGELRTARHEWDKRFSQLVADREGGSPGGSAPGSEAPAWEACDLFQDQLESCVRECLALEIGEQELAQQISILRDRTRLAG